MKNGNKYRLADSTVIEPLVNRWSAWAHLIGPVTASLHLLNYQVATLNSYLENPAFHFAASHDPQLIGGPFIDIPVERASEVEQFLNETREAMGDNIKFAQALTQFHNWLSEAAMGDSLEPYYSSIPDELRGYVELIYDYYNHPTVRLIEGLLYQSQYYKEQLQSLRLSRLFNDNERPFFMSTPRLPQPDQIDLAIPFKDEVVDQLFKLDLEPQPLEKIREILGLSASDDHRLLPLLSDQPCSVAEKWNEPVVRIKYFGHACVLIEWNGIAILTDAYVGAVPAGGGVSRLSYQDLPEKIDYILITHTHQDHFALETLLRLRHRLGTLVVPKSYGILYGDLSLKLMAGKLGFKRVIELDSMETIELPGGMITAIPFLGEHGDLGHGKSAYVVRLGGEQMLFGADSDCLDERLYQQVRRMLGPISTVYLGMECVGAPLSWSCGPLFPKKPDHLHDQTRRYHGCDSNAAMALLEAVEAEKVFNYAMGQEPWVEYLLGLGLSEDSTQIRESNRLLAKARGRGFLAAERLYGKAEMRMTPNASRFAISASGGDETSSAGGNAAQSADDAARCYPLSFFQEQLRMLNLRNPKTSEFNLTSAFRISGPLDTEALESALAEVISRHDILRYAFTVRDNRPAQVMVPGLSTKLEIIKLSDLPGDERESRALELISEIGGQNFDIENPPLLRACLFDLGEDDHIFSLTTHRIICDERSLQLLMKELAACYDSFAGATTFEQAPPEACYAHYAASQRRHFKDKAAEQNYSYWKRQLEGVDLSVGWPTNQSVSPAGRLMVSRHPITIPARVTQSLKELSRAQECSSFTILLAAWQAMLQGCAGRNEFVIATLRDARPMPETENAIGPFTNLLLLRTDLSDDPSFLELLGRCHKVVSTAEAHRDRPPVLMDDRSACETASGAPDLAQMMFVMESAPEDILSATGLRWESMPAQCQSFGCDLFLSLVDSGDKISGELNCNSDPGDAGMVAGMMESFVTFLESVISNPQTSALDLSRAGQAMSGDANAVPSLTGHDDSEDQFAF